MFEKGKRRRKCEEMEASFEGGRTDLLVATRARATAAIGAGGGDVVVARFRGPRLAAYLNEAAVCICARPGTMRRLNQKKGNIR
jgi:hypothetical protein